MAAYYRLRAGYLLRGWEKLPYVVVKPRTRQIKVVSKDMMRVLMRCDGDWDFDAANTSADDRRRARELLAKDYIERCDEGQGVMPEQRFRFYPNRFVQSVHWSVTGRCNYRCRHCFMSAPEGLYGELSREATMDIARQIGACGIPRVSLTGGEPLIRPDFLDIVAKLTQQGVAVTQIYTNGSRLTGHILDGLEELGQNPTIVMSFDGVGCHDWMRRVPGAERAVDAAFELCAERGFGTVAQVCVHRDNLGTMRETVRHLAALGCGSVRIGHVNDMGDWLGQGDDLTPTGAEWLEAALAYIPTYYEDGMPVPLTLSGVFSASPETPELYAVPPHHFDGDDPDQLLFACTRHTLRLYPDGRPAICSELDPDFVDMPPIASDDLEIETLPLREVLSSGSAYMDLMDLRCGRLIAANSECARCRYLRVCGGGCRAAAHRATGSIFAKDPDACAFFREGWARRVVETMRDVRPGARPILQEGLPG